jgi:hypothetical protein
VVSGSRFRKVYVKGDKKMKVSAVKYVTWVIALVLGVIALLGHWKTIGGAIADNAFWFAIAGLALMLVASLIRKL